ncbi:MAG: GFA family protein [Burkholderiaceae bacterium]|nr:GFA family protein [Burkholderiaceae bacterium]
MSTVLEGGCLCAKIRFRATQAPLRTLVCHCTFCQRMTGSSFYAESLFPIAAVEFEGGRPRKYEHTSDGSGKAVYVEFCADCGTTLGLTFERWPELRAISRGCYDNPNAAAITANIWTRSAQSGVALPSGIDCFNEARMTKEGVPERPSRYANPVMVSSAGDA